MEMFMSMSMVAMVSRATVFLVHALFWLLWLSSNTCDGVESDIRCLEDLHRALEDPKGYLTSWDFTNKTEGSICKFNGIECWHFDESKVLNILLSNMELKGSFPLALKNCASMTGLDLSGNELSGSLPQDIASIIPFVTNLNLSSNNFTGEIPSDLGNCSYLNVLSLQHNRFSGQIPWQIGGFERLASFSVADNNLSGPIPPFKKEIGPGSFANNSGLCGNPLDDCKGPAKRHYAWIIAISLVFAFVSIIGISFLCFHRVTAITAFAQRFVVGLFFMESKNKKAASELEEDIRGNRRRRSKNRTIGFKVTALGKVIRKMRLIDLRKATNNFSEDNIISSGRTGTMYKAMLPAGTFLALKRMQDSHRSIKRFISEMTLLGSIQHRNVVHLLGFCIARNERILVYKYLPKGTLHQKLHQVHDKANIINWPLRLKIAIGVARGLVWLHHHCNPCIVHRDISSKNILLDEEYEPVISNFKSARLMGSSIVNSIYGSAGYVAPEYRRMFEAIPKGDVYSFGVVLLELVTGFEPTQVANAPHNLKGKLVEWVAYLSNNSRLLDAIDKSFIGIGHNNDIFQFIRVACSCVVSDREERPTMLEVLQLLQAIGKRDSFTDEDEDEIQPPPNRIETDYAYLVMIPPEIQEIH